MAPFRRPGSFPMHALRRSRRAPGSDPLRFPAVPDEGEGGRVILVLIIVGCVVFTLNLAVLACALANRRRFYRLYLRRRRRDAEVTPWGPIHDQHRGGNAS